MVLPLDETFSPAVKKKSDKPQPKKSKRTPRRKAASSAAGSVERGAVTMRDVGDALGLSHVTVSLALSNNLRIPEERRRQIRAKAEEMGYRMNAAAAAMAFCRRSSKARPVTAVLAWLNFWPQPERLRQHAEFESYWKGASLTAEKLGYRLDEFVCDGKRITLSRLEQILLARGINGILLPPQRLAFPIVDFAWEKFSSIRFGQSVPKPHLHSITAHHAVNAMRAFEEARGLGYRRIGFVTGAYRRGVQFAGGYLMAQQLVPGRERLPLIRLNETYDSKTCSALERWIKAHRPDAILTDVAQLRGLLGRVGCRVPEDVGLAAMSVLDGNCDAGINQNPEEIGRVAALMLISMIHDGDRGVPDVCRHILLEGSWVNGSTMPARL